MVEAARDDITEGEGVEITTKSGRTWTKQVKTVIWETTDTESGEPQTLVSLVGSSSTGGPGKSTSSTPANQALEKRVAELERVVVTLEKALAEVHRQLEEESSRDGGGYEDEAPF